LDNEELEFPTGFARFRRGFAGFLPQLPGFFAVQSLFLYLQIENFDRARSNPDQPQKRAYDLRLCVQTF
jgi:hypothetical protein